MTRTVRFLPAALLFAAILGGCLARNAPEVAYYSLRPAAQLADETIVTDHAGMVLGIGPITLPDSLRRAQIATRETDNRFRFSEFQRWAGVLEQDMGMVLGENLGTLLGVEAVTFYPWSPPYQPTHRVILDIIRFDAALTGEAVLKVRWVLTDAAGRRSLAGGKSVYRRPLQKADYNELVRTESLLLADLSREIATAIRSLPR